MVVDAVDDCEGYVTKRWSGSRVIYEEKCHMLSENENDTADGGFIGQGSLHCGLFLFFFLFFGCHSKTWRRRTMLGCMY